ncbi:MAG: hypothetical protein H6739_31000 [Alphaproteobacteria bacterium]|nr:hypothetical protein [Alphaproteobacteria bacterium]
MLWLLLFSLAWASPGLDAVSAGDRARFDGDRAAAVDAYRAAIEAGEPAAEAMARLRLLSLSGNWGLIVHGPRIDEALYRSQGPWSALAWADFHLFAPAQVGADPAEAERFARSALLLLPGPALARLYLATGDPRWLAELEKVEARDGLAEGLLASDGALWPDPGTWFLGLGVAGAPGAGFGGGLVFANPDLARKEWVVSLEGAATTRGSYAAGLSVRSPGRVYGWGGGAVGRTVADVYVDDARQRFTQFSGQARLGPGLRLGDWRVAAGMGLRWDDVGEGMQAAHGPSASVAWDRRQGWGKDARGWFVAARTDGAIPALSDYPHWAWGADARGYVGVLKGVTAGRLTFNQELADAPFFRLPSAGGAELHRGAWAGRYRAAWIATADVEQRWMLIGPLEGVLFVNAAWVADDGLHPGGGAGLRLLLPPQRFNVVRLDVAVSDSGWGVYTGWGETF